LKHALTNPIVALPLVAPRVGAWIETPPKTVAMYRKKVAPRVGAWIETVSCRFKKASKVVAPRVGAWIET